MNFRKLAKGRECMVRVPNVCSFNPEETILAHVRLAGLSGIGIKANDLFASLCCARCHDFCDARSHPDAPRETRQLYLLEGVLRTQAIWLAEGRILT